MSRFVTTTDAYNDSNDESFRGRFRRWVRDWFGVPHISDLYRYGTTLNIEGDLDNLKSRLSEYDSNPHLQGLMLAGPVLPARPRAKVKRKRS